MPVPALTLRGVFFVSMPLTRLSSPQHLYFTVHYPWVAENSSPQ